MRGKLFVRFWVTLAMGIIVVNARAAEFDQSQTLLDLVLKNYVKDTRVNYAAVKVHPQELDRYLGQVEAVSESESKGWTGK